MSRPSVGIRLDVLGKREVIDALRDTGREGARMADKIERAGPPASKGLLAVDTAAGELKGKLSGLADQSGGLGRTLGSLGRAGTVAAIGLGAIVAGAAGLYTAARRATTEVAEMADQADRLGISAESLQRWQYATRQFGVDGEATADLLGEIADRAVQAAEGGGEATEAFAALGVSTLRADGSLKSMEELLPDIADGFRDMTDPMARVNAASSLFGDEGRKLIPLLAGGAEGLAEMGDEAQRAGLILSNEMVSAAQQANREFERQSDIISIQMRNAFVRLGPAISDLIPFVAAFVTKVAEAIAEVLKLLGLMDRSEVEVAQRRFDAAERRSDRNIDLARVADQDGFAGAMARMGGRDFDYYMQRSDEAGVEMVEALIELQDAQKREAERAAAQAEAERLARIRAGGGRDGGGAAGRADPTDPAVAAMDQIWERVSDVIEAEAERIEVTRKANEALADLVDQGVTDMSRAVAEAAFGLKDFKDVLRDTLLDIATDLPALLTGGTVRTGAGGLVQDLLGGVGKGVVSDSGGTIGDWVSSLMGFASGGGFEVTDSTSQMRIPARGGDDRLVAFRAQMGERVSVSRRGQSAGGAVVNQTIVIEGDATDATIERLRAAMRDEIATATPGIIGQSVSATGSEMRLNPDFAK